MANAEETAAAATRKVTARVAGSSREEQLEEQVARLQEDLKKITATLARLGGDKVSEARDGAKNLVRQGQDMVDDMSDQAGALEKQLKDTIREKPLTAVAGAMGLGFIIALLARH